MIAEGVRKDTLKALRTIRTPPKRHLSPYHPPRTPPSQVLALRDQTLMNRAGQQGDAVLVELIAKVLAGHADL